ncbi:unnamed protein product [Rhodiola kirilowii]
MSLSDLHHLPRFRFGEGSQLDSGSECVICLDKIRHGDLFRILPGCSHPFHLDCIDTWLVKASACPICRARVVIAGLEIGASGDEFKQLWTILPQKNRAEESSAPRPSEVNFDYRRAAGKTVIDRLRIQLVDKPISARIGASDMSDQSSSYPIICASFNQDNSYQEWLQDIRFKYRKAVLRACYWSVQYRGDAVQLESSCNCWGWGAASFISSATLLVVILQEKTFIYDLNNVAILDTIDTVPNLKGLCAFSYSLDGCFLALPASTTKGSVLVYNVMEFQSHCEIEAHRSPLTAITLSSNGMYLATASEQGTIIRVHLLSDASKSYSFRRGTYPSTIYSLALAPSAQLPDILVATSISGSVHAFSLGFATNRRIRRSNSLLGSIVPNSVSDMLDPAHHHVLHNVFPAGVKSYAVVRKVEKVEDESTSNPGYVAHRATVYIITFSGIFQEYSLTIDSQNLSSWNLMREFNLLTAIPTNVSKS